MTPNLNPRRGLSRFELGLAMAVTAAVGLGIAVMVKPAVAAGHASELEERAGALLASAEAWRTNHSQGCPTPSQLRQDGELSAEARLDDPWGGRLRIRCDEDGFSVVSHGPDGQSGTGDDVTLPER